MNVESVHVIRVQAFGRRRKLDRSKAKGLADSIAEIGLLNPITVCAAGDEYQLVAGRHRLEAVRLLGWDKVPAVVVELDDVDRLLAEIDENLIRNALSDMERAEHLAERKRLYLHKHPETAKGVAGARAKHGSAAADSAVASFAADTAAKTGASERAVRVDVQIAESIPEDVREAIRDTPIADSKTDLLDIARLPEEAQRDVIAHADLNDKASVRASIASHRPSRPSAPVVEPEPMVEEHTTEVVTTIEGFALAIASLFDVTKRRRLIRLIESTIKEEAAVSGN